MSTKYIPSLDGLRALAILSVMVLHFNKPLLPAGFLGVDVFFVLSGFLISFLLVQEWSSFGEIKLLNFYGRRALRLLPAVAFFLVVVSPFVSLPQVLSIAFYYSNWKMAVSAYYPFYLVPFWSLSVEEQYYILWPTIILLLLRSQIPKKVIPLIPLFLAAAAAINRAWLFLHGATADRIFYGTDTRADGLLIGSALGLAFGLGLLSANTVRKSMMGMLTAASAIVSVSILALSRQDGAFLPLGGYTLFAISNAAIVFAIAANTSSWLTKFLSWKPLVYTGKISYSLYIWHNLVNVLFLGLNLVAGNLIYFILRFAFSFGIAWVSYRNLERPLLTLKRRLQPINQPSSLTAE